MGELTQTRATRTRALLAELPLGPSIMIIAALVGLAWANLGGSTYHDVWSASVPGLGRWDVLPHDLHAWVNEGLMTLFFFAIGLEVKRELRVGDLRDRRKAALPMFAAAGGMAVPVGVYLIVAALLDAPTDGWAVPVATDVAFTLGALALLGSRVPPALRLFVLTLAVVDDIGGVVIIAVGFSEGISGRSLAIAIGIVAAIRLMRLAGVGQPLAYVPAGVGLWLALSAAGIEPAIAGVVLGLLTPAMPFGDRPVLEDLERQLAPFLTLAVLPVFAAANTGIDLGVTPLEGALRSPVAIAIAAGLCLGKPLGITAATWLARRVGAGTLDATIDPKLILPTATLAGIGFTVALFVAHLSFTDEIHVAQASVGVLAGSALAAVIGLRGLRRATAALP